MGALTQVNDADHLTEDIPFRTPNPPAFARGIYPLRWSGDYTNHVMVTNTAQQEHKVLAYITAGSVVYQLPATVLDSGGSML